MPILVFLVIVIVVLLVAKSLYDAQQIKSQQGEPSAAAPAPAAGDRPARSRPRSRPRRREQPPVIDHEELAAHVAKLRSAIAEGLVTEDEAVASIVRQTDGALSEEAARQLLADRDAA